MKKEYRIVGTSGDIPFDDPAEKPYGPPMQFLEYVMDDSGNICGAKFVIDLGYGYGFSYGEEVITIGINEEFTFEHAYTEMLYGTWDNGSDYVVVRLIEK